ncbi:cyclase family protein [Pasteurella oralis]|uniref:Cyclase family protein n=1 Tax=Pasteurella oralis TaxID=1071947 RepID=A0ABW4NWN3_9PAST|nr:cyclase family protein [Pasteurella oralis]MDO5055042.1 cyclase family protein [Pasteurella oralis]
MSNWIDLSMPICTNHVRWQTHIEKKGNFDAGDLFEATQLQVSCHAFTHMDALSHIQQNAYNILDISPDVYIGLFHVLDLSEQIQDNFAITAEILESIWPKENVERIIFKTCWDTHYHYNTTDFWGKSPYITEDGAKYLSEKNLKLVTFDFPQDYPIRAWLHNTIEKPLSKHVTHQHLLLKGVTLVEYICNTNKITSTRVEGLMLPIAIENADGAPCRVLVKNL